MSSAKNKTGEVPHTGFDLRNAFLRGVIRMADRGTVCVI